MKRPTRLTFEGLIGILLIFFFFTSCEKENTDPGIIVDIEPTFQLKMLENLSAPDGSLLFEISTLEEKECLNFELNYSLSQTVNSFSISLDELQEPEDCITGSTIVTEVIPLEPLQNIVYEVEFNLKNTVKNSGSLIVTNAYYELQLESFNGFLIQSKKLYKIPQEALWGQVQYDMEDLEPIAQQFVTELQNLTFSRYLPSGNYGYFNLDAQGEVWFPGSNETVSFGQNLIFHYDNPDIQPIIDLVGNYRDQYGPNLDIQLFSGRGIEF